MFFNDIGRFYLPYYTHKTKTQCKASTFQMPLNPYLIENRSKSSSIFLVVKYET